MTSRINAPSWLLGLGALVAVATTGCQTEAYCFLCEDDAAGGGAGGAVAQGGAGGAFVFPTNDSGAGGAVDPPDGNCVTDLQTDPNNCGVCGNVCDIPGAFTSCVAGQCQFDSCAEGLVDLDTTSPDCECPLTNDGVEVCNDLDDDCDGITDDGFNTTNDVEHCGVCNVPCDTFSNTSVACTGGSCVYTCADGFSSLGQLGLGCPYQCPVFPTVAETCNGVDENCDGIIDDGDPGAGVPCDDHCPIQTGETVPRCVGECASGTTVCTGTSAGIACVDGTRPNVELCDTLDNDCDGETDEGFDFDTDELNCGGCNIQCNSVDTCVDGLCDFRCEPNQRDLDGNPVNRCEYTCPVFPVGTEVCDGIDQDCDGAADNDATDVGSTCTGNCPAPHACVGTGNCGALAISANNGACYGVCSANGQTACPSGLPVCQYSNQRVDELCNGLDDNCDGRIDEGFDLDLDPANCGACGTVCGGQNVAARTCSGRQCRGITACLPGFRDDNGNADDGCEYACPVWPPTGEVCNGVDDDCDGVPDDSPSGSGQSCNSNCPAAAGCIAAGNCTNQISANLGGCYGVCAADGRTSCNSTGTAECTHPAQGTETCNGLDDDCDGLIDDGFSLLTDPLNCGSCGFNCSNLPGASAVSCTGGVCRSTACGPGFRDLDGNPVNGCEYACPVMPTRTERCDGVDDDCDGAIDDDPNDDNTACTGGACPAPAPCVLTSTCSYPLSPQTGSCYGTCRLGGSTVCSTAGPTAGTLVCSYTGVQAADTCNGLDDNCDGQIDEGFNKQTDSQNCGTCGNVCSGANVAARTCAAGVCGVITACTPGFRDVNGNPADGCEYDCPTFPPTTETCNGVDDDCSGGTDDGVVGLGQTCFTNCPAPEACVTAGNCTGPLSSNVNGCYGVCASDGRTTCPSGSTVCNHPVRGTETCNGLDDDCDGRIDEGFNTQTDVNNCGGCGVVCSLPGASTVSCVTGQCRVSNCTAGRANVDNNDANGCEYACPRMPTAAETCNGIDDDCDGLVDDSPANVGAGFPCSENCPGGNCLGICTTGAYACVGGSRVCQGGGGVQLEVCNNLDDDCNGTTDNGFNKNTDPLNCNVCGNVCNLTNVDLHACLAAPTGCQIAGNTSGDRLAGCDAGFSNRDGTHANGCEYTCPVYPARAETCNGLDDDCDGLTDGNDPSMSTPANFCDPDGPCAGSTPSCQGSLGWRCNYSASVEVNPATGFVALAETKCDGLDGNCNGQTDETFPLKGQPCTVGNGVCAGSSNYICSGGNSTSCPATAVPGNAVDESCNALDDNCDGLTDERTPVAGSQCFNGGQHACLGWRDPMVALPGNVWIHSHEASRPDATSSAYGVKLTRACSVQNRLPWESLNRAEAAAACAAVTNSAGQPMRLCTTTEWETACEGAAGVTATPLWSYSSTPGTYTAGRCNDNDPSTPTAPWATGTGADCRTPWGGASVFDLSGNVSEWTSTSSLVNSVTYYRVRGGNYQTFPQGTRCDFNFVLQQGTFQNFDLGFRCCSDAAP